MSDRYITADVLVAVTLEDNGDEPLTDSEVRQLTTSHSNWDDWDVIEVTDIERHND
jgi:hypothetical protein